MKIDTTRLKWDGLAMVAGAVAGGAVEQVLSSRWRRVRGMKPPDPADRTRSLAEAVLWRVAVGAAAGAATALSRRSTSALWERQTGSPPPGIRGDVRPLITLDD